MMAPKNHWPGINPVTATAPIARTMINLCNTRTLLPDAGFNMDDQEK